MKTKSKEIEIGVPGELLEYVEELENEIEQLRETEEKCPGAIRQMNYQFGKGLDDLTLSKGLGFDRGYNDCREHHLLRWIEMAIVHREYMKYEANLRNENAIDWSDWDKGFIHKSGLWDNYLKDMLNTIAVPDKDAFLQGWCEGVSKFFMSICSLIRCPTDFLPGKIST